MAIVANFTPDDVTWTHIGNSATLKSGGRLECNDGRANFILNKYGPRGLVKLEFSEDPDYLVKLKAEAKRRYVEFWRRQIYSFNQFNETLKNENKPYTHPDDMMTQKAQELGINLVGPWKTENTSNDVALKAALDNNAALQVQLNKLMEAVGKLQDRQSDVEDRSVGVPEIDWNKVKNSFFFLNRKDLKSYFYKHFEMMKSWPVDLKDEFAKKYEKATGKALNFDNAPEEPKESGKDEE
ncbi:MAG: hypothetical protein EHM41_00010 [Chloroflexi bacterium]|nr:MAG: hypothetical protein EHM41_00010 [Chloroflexota bacterium]